MTGEEVPQVVSKAVEYARAYAEEVQFTALDASRTDVSFLIQVAVAVQAGADAICLPDTVGHITPWEYGSGLIH